MRFSRGFTLTEVMVAATLLLLALGLAFGYLIPASRAANRLRIRAHLQQTAQVALRSILTEASTTSPRGFSGSSGPEKVALAFNPVDSIQIADASLRWAESYVIIWWEKSDHTLRERRWPPGPPSATSGETSIVKAKRLTAERLAEIINAEPTGGRILAKGVREFKVSHRGTEGAFVQPITVELTLVEEGRVSDLEGAESVSQRAVFRVENQQ